MSSQDLSSLELRIEKPEATIYVPITPEQRDEIVKHTLYLLWGEAALSLRFVSSEIGQEEARLRDMLHLQRNQANASVDSIPLIEEKLNRLTASQSHHLTIRLGELDRTYRELTEHIAELEKDLARSTDSEKKLGLRDRKAELEAEREEIVAKMKNIELELSRCSN